jgi:hypothetical protein
MLKGLKSCTVHSLDVRFCHFCATQNIGYFKLRFFHVVDYIISYIKKFCTIFFLNFKTQLLNHSKNRLHVAPAPNVRPQFE